MQYHNSLSKNYLPLFFVVGLLLCFESVLQFSVEESVKQAAIVLLYVVAVLCLQIVLLWLCGLLSSKLFLIAFCLGLVFNIVVLKALFYYGVVGLATPLFGGLILLLFGIALLLFRYSFKLQGQPNRWVYLSLLALFILPPLIDRGIDHLQHEAKPANTSTEALQPWTNIKFAQKPNIYLLSFDAFIPAAVARKYLAIEDLPYSDFMKNEMLNRPRVYSPRVPSRESLNSLMDLDQAAFSTYKDFKYFSGQSASVLSSIAHANHYEITTGYKTLYFGKPQGAYVDWYITPIYTLLSDTSLCRAADTPLLWSRFYGVCWRIGHYIANYLGEPILHGQWINKIFTSLKELALRDRPQIGLFYVYDLIGHASPSYRHANLSMRASYKTEVLESAKDLNKVLQDLVVYMRQIDPTALVMVFGDHGAYLSGFREYKGDDPIFTYEDRHRVELGVLKSQNACASDEQAFYYATETYTTPARTLASLFRCLAESPEQLDQLVDFIDPTEEIEWAEMSED